MPEAASTAGPGRRTGTSTTRAAIAEAARAQFAGLGYDGASLRAIAREAGVDPALITYFFGSKQRLFAEVVALPVDPETVLAHVLDGDPGEVGARLAGLLTGVLGEEGPRTRFVAIIRSAAQSDEVAAALRDRVTRDVLEPVATRVQEQVRAQRGDAAPGEAGTEEEGTEEEASAEEATRREEAIRREARLRAGLVMSQVAGMVFARHVIGLDALAEAPADELARALAPTLQRYLAEDL